MTRPLGSLLLLGLFACGGAPAVVGGPFPGDPANATYDLDGTSVTLDKGMHEVKTGSGVDDVIATDLTQVRSDADFDGDGSTDCAVVVTRDDGPLKLHYLAVITNAGKVSTVRLGKNVLVDKLSPHPKGGVSVKMLGRDDGVPEDMPPTITIEKRFELKNGSLAQAK